MGWFILDLVTRLLTNAAQFYKDLLSLKLLSACALLSSSSYLTLTSIFHLLSSFSSLVERHHLLVSLALFRSKLSIDETLYSHLTSYLIFILFQQKIDYCTSLPSSLISVNFFPFLLLSLLHSFMYNFLYFSYVSLMLRCTTKVLAVMNAYLMFIENYQFCR